MSECSRSANELALLSKSYFAVPPKIVDDQTSSDLVVRENSVVNLTCQAEGWPKPRLRWSRADGEMIKYQGGTGKCEFKKTRYQVVTDFARETYFSDDSRRKLPPDPQRLAGAHRKVLLHCQQWNSTNRQ